jgi:hypothetical protein
LKAQVDERERIASNQAAKGKRAKNIREAKQDMEGTAVMTPTELASFKQELVKRGTKKEKNDWPELMTMVSYVFHYLSCRY